MNKYDDLFILMILRDIAIDVKSLVTLETQAKRHDQALSRRLVDEDFLTNEAVRELMDCLEEELRQCDWNRDQLEAALLKGIATRRLWAYVEALKQSSRQEDAERNYLKNSVHAEGGLGQIWKVTEVSTGREVALKCIKPKYASDEEVSRRFVSEARITARLEHPSIVPVYHVHQGEDGTAPFYVMRLLEGQTLQAAVKDLHEAKHSHHKRQSELRSLLHQFLNAAAAIAYAHANGIIHRDLKPSNIVLSDFRSVFVLDWGIAKIMDDANASSRSVQWSEENDELTQQGQAMGTPMWMSPEQASGSTKYIDERTDVFGLGAVLYTILTGSPPHQRRGKESMHAFFARIATNSRPEKQLGSLSVPEELGAICHKAMAHRREDRYQCVKELIADVENWLSDEPTSVSHVRPIGRLVRWSRRNPAPALATISSVFLTLLGLITISIWMFWTSGRALADYVHTEVSATWAVIEERIKHQSVLVRVLASHLEERSKGNNLDPLDINSLIDSVSRFRRYIRALHVVDPEAMHILRTYSSHGDCIAKQQWSQIDPRWRAQIADLQTDEFSTFIGAIRNSDNSRCPVILAATPLHLPGDDRDLLAVLEANPVTLFEDVFLSAPHESHLVYWFSNATGNELFSLHEQETKSPPNLDRILGPALPSYEEFLDSKSLDRPLMTDGTHFTWCHRLYLPCSNPEDRLFIGGIAQTPISVHGHNRAAREFIRTTPYYMMTVLSIASLSLLLVVVFVTLRIVSPRGHVE
ncbi:Serine/threonine-protein kinase PknD [Planctomycetes bacterium Pan216]|uniref:Serine/threonine-protein kinase PknD n=1 Tax=Kolteria novifilia TaxID=2527975 RepID=A0A518B0Z3_9BACT|nr:Serine/threonine-protein kinase PknD [Planctomycetes bacterium Pan216]